MYILNYYRKGKTNVEKLCNYFTNKLYYCFYDSKSKKLKNKNNTELKWNLLKNVSKLRNYSKEYKEFSKNCYLSNLFLKDAFEKISSGKLNREKKDNNIDTNLSCEEKNEFENNINITVNSFLNKDIDFVCEDDNNNLIKHKRKKPEKEESIISKKEEKKNYIENNRIKNAMDFLPPNLSENENIFIIESGNKFTFKLDYQQEIGTLLKINNINNITRGIFPIHCLFGNYDYAILYICLKEISAILVYFSQKEEKLLLYDLTQKKIIKN